MEMFWPEKWRKSVNWGGVVSTSAAVGSKDVDPDLLNYPTEKSIAKALMIWSFCNLKVHYIESFLNYDSIHAFSNADWWWIPHLHWRHSHPWCSNKQPTVA